MKLRVLVAVCWLLLLAGAPPAAAQITVTSLTSGADTTDADSYVTASISPTGNRLLLLCVVNTGTVAASPTATGNGLTWVTVNNQTWGVTNQTSILRAMGASPSSGAVTIDFAGNTRTGTAWSITQFANVDTSGTDGSGAVVQSNGGSEVLSTTAGITLNAFGSPDNIAYGCLGIGVQENITPGAGFTEVQEVGYATPGTELETEWQLNQTSVVWSWTTLATAGGVAVEIAFAAGGVPGSRLVLGAGQ